MGDESQPPMVPVPREKLEALREIVNYTRNEFATKGQPGSLLAAAGAVVDAVSERDPDEMCPNCVTPWKCSGPHLNDTTDTVPVPRGAARGERMCACGHRQSQHELSRYDCDVCGQCIFTPAPAPSPNSEARVGVQLQTNVKQGQDLELVPDCAFCGHYGVWHKWQDATRTDCGGPDCGCMAYVAPLPLSAPSAAEPAVLPTEPSPADVWAECCKAFAWCLDQDDNPEQALTYVIKNNPHAAAAGSEGSNK